MKISRTNLFILSFLVVFGFAIRLYNLGAYPYHVDEKFTIDLVSKPFIDVLIFGLSQDCNPPLFYLVDWFFVHAFGFVAFWERFPAVIFGVLAIPATFMLGRELRDDTVGILAAAVVTTLGSMWYYSQFGRGYTMVLFLFTLALIYFIRLVRGDHERRTWLSYGILATLCVWTHLYALVPLGFMGLYLFYLYGWDSVRKPLLAYLPIAGLAGTFWAIHKERGVIMQGWMGNTPAQLLQYITLEYFAYSAAIFCGLIGISTWMNRRDKVVPLLVGIWVLSFVAQLIISMITPVFARYTMLMVPMLVVVAMEPVGRFLNHEESTPAQKAFVMVVFSAMYLIITAYQFTSGAYEGRQL